jgi:hypothetical protein
VWSQALKGLIYEAILNDNEIVSKTLQDQWKTLILEPLSKLEAGSVQTPLIIVIDALDECDREEDDIRRILQLLSHAQVLRTVRFRVLITSRPEISIRRGLSALDAQRWGFVLHDEKWKSTVDHDISVFVEYELKAFGQKDGANWPGEQDIKSLVVNAGGLFIWASTACRFIKEGRKRKYAANRLSTLLEASTSVTAPDQKLNEIYITVLKNSVRHSYDDQEKDDLYKMLRDILGSIVTLFSPLSTDSLSRLRGIPIDDIDEMLEDLHAILDIPKQHIPKGDIDQALEDPHAILDIQKQQSRLIRLHHPSFRDFLLDKDKCSDFWVDEKQMHNTLADNCIQVMSNKLKRDICGLHAPSTLAKEVENDQLEQCLPLELQYACRYWVQHLQKSGLHLHDDGPVHMFLREHLLHWFEALSLMEKGSEGILAITLLESIIKVGVSLGKFT